MWRRPWNGARSTGKRSSRGGATRATEIHHFIGKDITYFHTLFWPAMLEASGFNLPWKIHVHGFLDGQRRENVENQGNVRTPLTYLNDLDPAYLAPPLRLELMPKLDDLDMNLDEFVDQDQCRPGRQGGEPGQPHGELS